MEHGRHPDAGVWFQTRRVGLISAVLVTLAVTAAVAQYQYAKAPELQQAYLKLYIRSTIAAQVGIPEGTYALTVRDGIITPQPARYRHWAIAAWLKAAIFDGQSLTDLVMPVLRVAGAVLLVTLPLGIWMDRTRARTRRQGRVLRGPECVSPREFTKRIKEGQW